MVDLTIGGLTIYEIIWYFMIYSFLGWVLEVIYHAVSQGIVVNRGFLNGPVCPIYGFGMIVILLLLNTLFPGGSANVHGALLFGFGIVLASAVELFGGWALDKIFHARWWDYSDEPFNLNGYICPKFSIYWGLGTVIAVRMLHPFVAEHTVDVWPERYGMPAAALLMMIYAADLVVTVMIVNGLNKELDELDTLRASMRIVSDDLTDVLGKGSLRTAQRMEEGRVKAEIARGELQEQLESRAGEIRGRFEVRKAELEAKRAEIHKQEQNLYEKMLHSRIFGARRLFNAFPDLKIPDHEELLKTIREKLDQPV